MASEKVIRVIASMSAMRIPVHRIGLALGLSGDYINTLRRTDLYKTFEQDFLEKLEKEAFTIEREIQELAADALNVHKAILACEKDKISPRLLFDTARDILDRAGHKKPEEVNLNQQGRDPWLLVLSHEDFEEKYGREEEKASDLEEDLSNEVEKVAGSEA